MWKPKRKPSIALDEPHVRRSEVRTPGERLLSKSENLRPGSQHQWLALSAL